MNIPYLIKDRRKEWTSITNLKRSVLIKTNNDSNNNNNKTKKQANIHLPGSQSL